MNGDTIRSSLGQIFQEFQDETVVQQFIPDHQRALKKIKRCCIYPIYHFTLPMKIMSSLLAQVQWYRIFHDYLIFKELKWLWVLLQTKKTHILVEKWKKFYRWKIGNRLSIPTPQNIDRNLNQRFFNDPQFLQWLKFHFLIYRSYTNMREKTLLNELECLAYNSRLRVRLGCNLLRNISFQLEGNCCSRICAFGSQTNHVETFKLGLNHARGYSPKFHVLCVQRTIDWCAEIARGHQNPDFSPFSIIPSQ